MRPKRVIVAATAESIEACCVTSAASAMNLPQPSPLPASALMRELFDSFRDWQRANGYEAGTAQPIKVGDTVEAVTSAPDGLIKGECYRVKQVTERAPYPYHLGGGLWVSADDIRLVREHEAKL